MAGHGGRKNRKSTNYATKDMVRKLDALEKFEDFKADILPKLRKMMAKPGVTAEEILEFSKAYAVAKVATIAFSDEDNGRALAAAKDLIDRSIGKAKERVETEHRFGKLKDEELDALLTSRLKEVATEGDEDPDKH